MQRLHTSLADTRFEELLQDMPTDLATSTWDSSFHAELEKPVNLMNFLP